MSTPPPRSVGTLRSFASTSSLADRSVALHATVRSRCLDATEEFLTIASGSPRMSDQSVRTSSVGEHGGGLENGRVLVEDDGDAVLRWDVKVLVVEDETKVARALKEAR